jgi:hypothetical protein
MCRNIEVLCQNPHIIKLAPPSLRLTLLLPHQEQAKVWAAYGRLLTRVKSKFKSLGRHVFCF